MYVCACACACACLSISNMLYGCIDLLDIHFVIKRSSSSFLYICYLDTNVFNCNTEANFRQADNNINSTQLHSAAATAAASTRKSA